LQFATYNLQFLVRGIPAEEEDDDSNRVDEIRMIRFQLSGRFNPIADNRPPSRNRIEISPIAKRSKTSLGTIRKTLWPMTIKEPRRSSNPLSVRAVESFCIESRGRDESRLYKINDASRIPVPRQL
jgi:hypothetical protein